MPVLLLSALPGHGQGWGRRNLQVGIIAPLYLDSVFSKNQFRYENEFPRFVFPGMDFMMGAELALSNISLPKGVNIRTRLIDSKSAGPSLEEKIQSGAFENLDMIISSVKDDEFLLLSSFAGKRNIPLISSTYPNDGGVRLNPNLVIINPTLRSHCEAIFAFLMQSHGTDNIYLVRQPGMQEDKVEAYFKRCNKPDGKELIKLKIIDAGEDIGILASKLDSMKTSVIIGGSLDEEFAEKLAGELFRIKSTYKTKLIGMPNWDGFDFVKRGSFRDQPVYFTSYYFNDRSDSLSKLLQKEYVEKYKGAPSDFAFKGFETTRYFIQLLTMNPEDPLEGINKESEKMFSGFYIKPTYLKGKGFTPDYFENKHLYLLKSMNGNISAH